jgi:general L-amino acid transport system ATP-binding protein
MVYGQDSAPDIAVTLNGVNKWYGNFHALKNIDLTVRRGEKVVVCGPSGSGKSTMIRCINRLEAHENGRITVTGLDLTEDKQRMREIRRKVGMVFQQFNLFPHLSILENCTVAPIWTLGRSRRESEERAMHFLQSVHIADQSHKYPGQLSGGQQQRAAIARALCMDPEIMLFDEPTSALDPEMISEVLSTMVELAEAGMTMICVTHEMNFARQVADRVIFMDNGEVKESASPDEFFDAPRDPRLQKFLEQIIRAD